MMASRREAEALSAYRSQFPLEPGMLPEFLFQEMFGREYFVASAAGLARSSGRDAPGPSEPALARAAVR